MSQLKAQAQFLLSNAADHQKRILLSSMTMQRLFFTSTQSAELFKVVSSFLQSTRRHGKQDTDLDSVAVATSFSDLPPELGLRVVDHLPYADRCRFAQTSNYAAALAAETLQSAAAKLLASFSLLYEDVKMMQTATGAAFYGLAVDALLRTTEDCLEVTRLELVVPKACGAVVARFLALASQYTIASDDSEDNVAVLNVCAVWILTSVSRKIIVLECDTSNPLDVIARSPITSLYNAWTANELWIGYANLTASGVAYATSLNFPLLSPPSAHRKMWRVMRQCMQAGHVLSLRGYTCPHICGVDVSCPATLRTSCDAGCAISRFPVWRYSSESVASAPVCWSMGGGGCAQGHLANGVRTRRLSSDVHGNASSQELAIYSSLCCRRELARSYSIVFAIHRSAVLVAATPCSTLSVAHKDDIRRRLRQHGDAFHPLLDTRKTASSSAPSQTVQDENDDMLKARTRKLAKEDLINCEVVRPASLIHAQTRITQVAVQPGPQTSRHRPATRFQTKLVVYDTRVETDMGVVLEPVSALLGSVCFEEHSLDVKACKQVQQYFGDCLAGQLIEAVRLPVEVSVCVLRILNWLVGVPVRCKAIRSQTLYAATR
ncbi:hypothetical protein R3P38DRAFT_2776488 [Favolaschia claudopus]|uniref:F-box domain-containing protein n=1 Tax=Favolaschia claudopus TaxID=2862362 RepID=A0AAW0BMH6_9AGAR